MNDIIYTEGSQADSAWVVYLGERVLLKSHKNLKPGEKINLTKQSPILNLTKGGYSTFEATDPGINMYQGTLVVSEISIHFI